MLWHTCPSVALCQYMILWSATYNIMERLLPACCDMCPSVALCQLLLNLWSATAISAQATSAKQNSKKKKNISDQSNSYHSCYIWRIVQIKIQFNSFEQSLQMWHKFLQIAAALWCNLFKGPIWHILYSGSSSKMTKFIQVTHFLFFLKPEFWKDFVWFYCKIFPCLSVGFKIANERN